jgi:hypothetical protein
MCLLRRPRRVVPITTHRLACADENPRGIFLDDSPL